ncbi:MAG: gamma carbonic anhydrase family protein, partial [Flavobacteriales bacterium]|nr:gamma carbonic anhydrase family protein [Flavobacteriales bacterium]
MSEPIIHSVNGLAPFLEEDVWVAPNATVVGDVHIGAKSSIWYQSVLRGDVGKIVLGKEVNIQDGTVIHSTTGKSTVTLGNRVSVGHRAIVHGCTSEEEVLIGMGAIVMDNAYLERGSIVAAGAVVLENTRVEGGWIWAGVPAKPVKKVELEVALRIIR